MNVRRSGGFGIAVIGVINGANMDDGVRFNQIDIGELHSIVYLTRLFNPTCCSLGLIVALLEDGQDLRLLPRHILPRLLHSEEGHIR